MKLRRLDDSCSQTRILSTYSPSPKIDTPKIDTFYEIFKFQKLSILNQKYNRTLARQRLTHKGLTHFLSTNKMCQSLAKDCTCLNEIVRDFACAHAEFHAGNWISPFKEFTKVFCEWFLKTFCSITNWFLNKSSFSLDVLECLLLISKIVYFNLV